MEYKKKRGTQYFEEKGVIKTRKVKAYEWEGPDGQIYRAPITEAGEASLDRRRERLIDGP